MLANGDASDPAAIISQTEKLDAHINQHTKYAIVDTQVYRFLALSSALAIRGINESEPFSIKGSDPINNKLDPNSIAEILDTHLKATILLTLYEGREVFRHPSFWPKI